MQHHPQYKFMSDTYFPCTFIGHQQSVIILWCYPTDDKLTILTDHQQQLICFKNKDELKNRWCFKKYAEKNRLDFDKIEKCK